MTDTVFTVGAQWQWQKLSGRGAPNPSGGFSYEGLENLYRLWLRSEMERPFPSQNALVDKAASRLCADIAYYGQRQGMPPQWEYSMQQIADRAMKLDPRNAVAFYVEAVIEGNGGGPDAELPAEEHKRKAIALCQQAIRLDENFTEAWMALSMLDGGLHDYSASHQCLQRYLDTLKFYRPELHYFDPGYPAINETIHTDNGNLVRKVYHDTPERFSLRAVLAATPP